MEAGSVSGSFDRLRVHSIGLPQVLFQSITHMAPAAAVAYSIYISVPFSRQALVLSVLLALIACLCAATAIGQLAKLEPSAGGLYAYAARSLGPGAGFNVAWLFILFEPLVAPFLYLEFGWAMREVMSSEAGWHWSGQWVLWVFVMAAIVFCSPTVTSASRRRRASSSVPSRSWSSERWPSGCSSRTPAT